MNIGMYGLPSYSTSIEKITKYLEKITMDYGGRKVLYSRSYYTVEEFWKIYSRAEYAALRRATSAEGIFLEITDKILSE